jgi:hypothetical protein
MSVPPGLGGPEGDENNDDTFGSSMIDVGTLPNLHLTFNGV